MNARQVGILLLWAIVAGCAPAPKGGPPPGPLNFPAAEDSDLRFCEKAAGNLTWTEFSAAVDAARREVQATDPQDRAYQVGMRVAQKHPEIEVFQIWRCCRGTRFMTSGCAFYAPQFWGNP